MVQRINNFSKKVQYAERDINNNQDKSKNTIDNTQTYNASISYEETNNSKKTSIKISSFETITLYMFILLLVTIVLMFIWAAAGLDVPEFLLNIKEGIVDTR